MKDERLRDVLTEQVDNKRVCQACEDGFRIEQDILGFKGHCVPNGRGCTDWVDCGLFDKGSLTPFPYDVTARAFALGLACRMPLMYGYGKYYVQNTTNVLAMHTQSSVQ